MSDFKILSFDPRGDNADNLLTEQVVLDDTTLDYIKPDYTPFYSSTVVITDKDGQVRNEGTDYVLEGLVVPLVKTSGKDVKAYIRIVNTELYAKSPLSIRYHSCGINHFPKSMVANTSTGSEGNSLPIDWNTQVLGKPSSYPFKPHIHNVETEIAAWTDLADEIEEIYQYRKNHILSKYQELKGLSDAVWTATDLTAKQLRDNVMNHDRDLDNPHDVDAADVLLGNVDNFATATANDELLGSADKFSTPLGAQSVLNNSLQTTDGYHHIGRLPLSYYGTDFYIPPPIEGDFKGMWTNCETAGFCLEDNGTLMMLANASDGKHNGLFYTTIENWDSPNPKVRYTGYPYQWGNLDYRKLNAIVEGSGKDVMIVGNRVSQDWYITLTKGTFDPAKHNLHKISFDTTPPGMWDNYVVNERFPWFDISKVFVAGNYVWLMYLNHQYFSNELRMAKDLYFYRIPLSAFDTDGPLVFQAVTLTSAHNVFGTLFSNVKPLRMTDPVKKSNGYYNNSWCRTSLDLTSSFQWIKSVIIPTDYDTTSNKKLIYLETRMHDYYYNGSVYSFYSPALQFIYIFDPDNNTFLLHPDSGRNYLIDLGNTSNNPQRVEGRMGNGDDWVNIGRNQRPSICAMNGYILKSQINQTYTTFKLKTDLLSWFKDPYSGATGGTNALTYVKKSYPMVEPPGAVQSSYFDGAEIYGVYGPNPSGPTNVATKMGLYLRTGLGDYANHPEMRWDNTNLMIRLPSNQDFKIAGGGNYARCSVTGDAAALTAAGTTIGWTGFSVYEDRGVFDKFTNWPAQPSNQVVLPGNITWDTSVPGVATAQVNSTVNYPTTIINQIKAVLTNGIGATKYSSFTLYDFTYSPFADVYSVATLFYTKPGSAGLWTRFILFKPTVTTSGTVKTVTGYSVLYNSGEVVNDGPRFFANIDMSYFRGYDTYPIVEVYVNRTTGIHYYNIYPGVCFYPSGSTGAYAVSYIVQSRIQLQRATSNNAITVTENTTRPTWYNDEYYVTVVPKVGRVTVYGIDVLTEMANTGSITTVNGTRYVTAHTYPADNWYVYFTNAINVTIEGGSYLMPTGSISLYDIVSNPVDKTFYVYIRLNGTKAEYFVTTKKLYVSSKMLFVATITTNDKGISSIDLLQPMMVGDLVLSNVRRGQAIPVVDGSLGQEATVVWKRSQDN